MGEPRNKGKYVHVTVYIPNQYQCVSSVSLMWAHEMPIANSEALINTLEVTIDTLSSVCAKNHSIRAVAHGIRRFH